MKRSARFSALWLQQPNVGIAYAGKSTQLAPRARLAVGSHRSSKCQIS